MGYLQESSLTVGLMCCRKTIFPTIYPQMKILKTVILKKSGVPQTQIRKFYLHKILIIFLPINLNMWFGCSKEPSH